MKNQVPLWSTGDKRKHSPPLCACFFSQRLSNKKKI